MKYKNIRFWCFICTLFYPILRLLAVIFTANGD